MNRWPLKALACAWVALLLTLTLSLFWRLPHYVFDAGLLSLLPNQTYADAAVTERIQSVESHLQRMADRELIVLVGSPDAPQSRQWAERIRQELRSDVRQPVDIGQQQLNEFSQHYFPYRSFLLTDADALALEQAPEHLLGEARNRLYSPLASGYDAIRDPFWLFQHYLQGLAQRSPVNMQDEWPTLHADTMTYRLLRFRLQGDVFDLSTQADLLERLSGIRAALPAGVELLTSGLVVHAAYGAAQARREISTVGLGSLLGVLLLLWLALGRWQTLGLLLICVSTGLLVAFSLSLWVFEQLHLITLAFGASLIGVGIDYGIHTWMALTHGERLRRLLPALSLGLMTSLLAYGVQGVMPFPGLQQMALFSCVGLVAAWISACLFLPLAKPGVQHSSFIFRLVDIWWTRAPVLHLHFIWLPLLLLGLIGLWFAPGDDRLKQLQTSPGELLAQEFKVQQLLQIEASGRYFVVSAGTEAGLDQRLSHLTERLEGLREGGVLSQFSSLHDWRPPLTEQQQARRAIVRFYHQQAPGWFSALGAPDQAQNAQAALAQDAKPLTLAAWNSRMPQPHLYLRSDAGEHLALVPLQGVTDVSRLRTLEDRHVQFVDRAGQLGELLGHYRLQLQHWTVCAMVLALMLLLGWFGWSRLPVLAVPVLAVVVTCLLISFFGGLTLFHCLALLLVLGIGFDSSIFLLGSSEPTSVWRATSLSIMTSMISFGLLALSQTPVLHFFGVTVLIGLGFIWLLLPPVYKGLPVHLQDGVLEVVHT